MHYYQYNIADYRKDTMHLSVIEHYIYRTLIDWYYLDEQPIPKETQVVIRRLRLETQHEPNLLNVLNDFFVDTENGWLHPRINKEINAYHAMCEKNQHNGKLGGRPKKTQSVNLGNPNKSQKKPKPITNNHKPITNNQVKEKNIKKENADFERFWDSYPKKVGKQEALKNWEKKKPPIDQVLKTLEWQKKSQQWLDNFIPNPSTYLNQGRWEDEPQHTNFTKPNARGSPSQTKLEAVNSAARAIFKGHINEQDITSETEVIEHLFDSRGVD